MNISMNKSKLILLLSVCMVLLIAGVVLTGCLVTETGKASDYDNATALMEDGRYTEAYEIFKNLGTYHNASGLMLECQNAIDYNTAIQHMDSSRFQEAKRAFEALGDFKDSRMMAIECQKGIDYALAMEVMSSKDFAGAKTLFEALIPYKDSASFATECGNRVIYAKADSAYDDEYFYTAYTLFKSISGFSDSCARADSCVQDYPATGEIYRSITGTAVSLIFRTPGDDPRPTFLRIYTEENELVSSVFIRSGDSPTIKLPEGKYYINMAYGENWFGPGDMFGDDAEYQTLQLDRDSEAFAFESNYIYTFRLRTDTYHTDHKDTGNERSNGF